MVSSELLRRYPFFAGLSYEHILALAKIATEIHTESEHYFFREGEELQCFYLVIEGAAAIVMEVPDQDVKHTLAEQFSREMQTRDIVISAAGPGDIFGWSGLVPPHQATASTKAITPCRVVAFDCQTLRQIFEEDCRFGYSMMQKVAQVIRERLRDAYIESLAHTAAA